MHRTAFEQDHWVPECSFASYIERHACVDNIRAQRERRDTLNTQTNMLYYDRAILACVRFPSKTMDFGHWMRINCFPKAKVRFEKIVFRIQKDDAHQAVANPGDLGICSK